MSKALLTLRHLAGLPLLGIGIQHLTGAAPMLPILEGAGCELPGPRALRLGGRAIPRTMNRAGRRNANVLRLR